MCHSVSQSEERKQNSPFQAEWDRGAASMACTAVTRCFLTIKTCICLQIDHKNENIKLGKGHNMTSLICHPSVSVAILAAFDSFFNKKKKKNQPEVPPTFKATSLNLSTKQQKHYKRYYIKPWFLIVLEIPKSPEKYTEDSCESRFKTVSGKAIAARIS